MADKNNNQIPLAVGYKLAHYEIIKQLGKGGFGITYLALDEKLNKPVAIKEYFPDALSLRGGGQTHVSVLSTNKQKDFDEGLARFKREALMLSEFNHPNIVKVLGYFEANSTAYFVMDYIDGQSLEGYQKEKCRALTQDEIVHQCLPVLKGLKEVHAKSMLHLDIKPDNILQTKYGQPLLIDFGGARVVTSKHSQDLSRHSSMVATDGYAPTEQYSLVADQTAATDLYAFGMTLYKLMCPGEVLAKSIDRKDLVFDELPDPLRPIRDVAPGYSEALYQVVEACTRLKQKERPQSVEDIEGITEILIQSQAGAEEQEQSIEIEIEQEPSQPVVAPEWPEKEEIQPSGEEEKSARVDGDIPVVPSPSEKVKKKWPLWIGSITAIVVLAILVNAFLPGYLRQLEVDNLRAQFETSLSQEQLPEAEEVISDLRGYWDVSDYEIDLLKERLALKYTELAEKTWDEDWDKTLKSISAACRLGHSGACGSPDEIIEDILKVPDSLELANTIYQKLEKINGLNSDALEKAQLLLTEATKKAQLLQTETDNNLISKKLRERFEAALDNDQLSTAEKILSEMRTNSDISSQEIEQQQERLALRYYKYAEKNWGDDWDKTLDSISRACQLGHSGACQSADKIIADILRQPDSYELANSVFQKLKNTDGQDPNNLQKAQSLLTDAHNTLTSKKLRARFEAALGNDQLFTAGQILSEMRTKSDISGQEREQYQGRLAQRNYKLAEKYESNDVSKAVPYFRQACSLGEEKACTELGFAYREGLGVEKSNNLSVTYFGKACDAGEMDACFELGMAYHFGKGIDKNYSKAVELYQDACDADVMNACSKLGWLYRDGSGVEQSYAKAAEFYRKACDSDIAVACNNLGAIYRDGKGVGRDYGKAAIFFQKGCDNGDMWSCNYLSSLYRDGKGVAKNHTKSAELDRKVCNSGSNGSRYACNQLAMKYDNGLGVERNDVKAVELYRKACDASYMAGCNNLGLMYEYGEGVSKSNQNALALYKQACDGGYERACEHFDKLSEATASVATETDWRAIFEERLAANRLTLPAGNSALDAIKKLEKGSAGDKDFASSARVKVAERYYDLAMKKADQKEFSKALEYIDKGLDVSPGHEGLLSYQALVEASRDEATRPKLVAHANGTATQGNLMWMRCAVGQKWTGSTCEGEVVRHDWQDALSSRGSTFNNYNQSLKVKRSFAGYSDWRLPTYAELNTLIYCTSGREEINLKKIYDRTNDREKFNGSCLGNDFQSPTMDLTVFPNRSKYGSYFWSSSKGEYNSWAMVVDFENGNVYERKKTYEIPVLLVRTIK